MTTMYQATPRQQSLLDTLENLKARRLEIDSQISLLVKAAVVEQCTWRAIGEALGTSGQAAWEKHRSEHARKIAASEEANHVEQDE